MLDSWKVVSVKQKNVLIDTRSSANGLAQTLGVGEELSASIFMLLLPVMRKLWHINVKVARIFGMMETVWLGIF